MKRALAALGLLALSANARAGGGATLTIEVKTTSNAGIVRCALWSDPAGFPEDVLRDSVRRIAAPTLEKHHATCVFTEVAPSDGYALAVLQDLNSNNALDKSRIGIPKEPLGFSNNVRIFFRAPTYDEAKFSMTAADQTLQVSVH